MSIALDLVEELLTKEETHLSLLKYNLQSELTVIQKYTEQIPECQVRIEDLKRERDRLLLLE